MLTNNIPLLIQITVSHYGYIVTFNATFVIYLPRSDVVILFSLHGQAGVSPDVAGDVKRIAAESNVCDIAQD